jgi:hypothetical protein
VKIPGEDGDEERKQWRRENKSCPSKSGFKGA